MHRRAFIANSAAAILSTPASRQSPPGPSDGEACSEEAAGAFVWRPMMVARGDIPALNGHTDTGA